jgi:hypothetical protein
MRLALLAGACLVLSSQLAGCVTHTQPEEFFQLTAESPANKAMQSRFFETKDEAELLSASAAVLQDLGFQVEESVQDVGFLRATKERSAREYGQDITPVVSQCYSNKISWLRDSEGNPSGIVSVSS